MTKTQTDQAENLLGIITPKKLAKALGVTVRTLQIWRGKRTGPPVVQESGCRRVYYRISSVEAWLAARERRR